MSGAKTKHITIKFSEKEYDAVLQRASSNNMPLATYVRERIFFDIPQIEHQSFEFKMLKNVSYCVGSLMAFGKLKLSDEDRGFVADEIMRVMKSNGLDENLVRAKISQG